MVMRDGFKRLGEERLTWFSEAKKSIHHARAVVDLNYPKTTEAPSLRVYNAKAQACNAWAF